jgi:DNA-binding transcriptional MerR regulator
LSLRTVRYYEEIGLVEPSERTPGGFRLYTEADVDLLRLVKRMKALEFSLDDSRALLAVVTRLAADPPVDERGDLAGRLRAWQWEVERRCATLRERLQVAEGLAARLSRIAPAAPSPEVDTVPRDDEYVREELPR